VSTPTRPAVDVDALRATLATRRRALLRLLFGDRLGLTLFCGTLFVLGVTWRQAAFINDNYTVANALVAVADGHLDLRTAAYGPGLATPGAVESGGRVYGRNYGHVLLALPVLLLLRGLAAVADLRVLLTGVWAVCLLWTLRGAGASLGHQRAGTLLGSGLALLVFAGSVPLASDLPADWLPFLALQAVSVVAAALLAVTCYRLVEAMHGRRVGLAAGGATVLATGVGFWATIPKRHVLVALIAVAAVYALYRSRAVADGERADIRYRAAAYATAGPAAWVAAPEGAILGLAVAAADLSTAGREDLAPRALVGIGVATVLAFLPFLLTNLAIAGDPLEPPRQLASYQGGDLAGGGGTGGGGQSGGAGGGGGTDSGSTGSRFGAGTAVGLVVGRFLEGATVAVTEPGRVVRTFLRTGYSTDAWSGANEILGANLSVLESAPVLGALAGTVALGARRIRAGASGDREPGIGVVDAFAVGYALLLTLAYLPRLPLHASVTVRYLVPTYPLLVYAVARLPAVRRAVEHRWRTAAWSYAGTVLVGGQLFLAAVTLRNSAVGESMQTHAVVDLGLASLLAGWAVAATLATRRGTADGYDTAGAVLLGTAAGAATVLVLLASVAYFPVGEFLLPLVPDL